MVSTGELVHLTKPAAGAYARPVRTVKVHEAKTQFSKLLAAVEAGEEIIVQRGDTPVAKLVPLPKQPVRKAGALKGKMWMAEDFDSDDLGPEWDEYLR